MRRALPSLCALVGRDALTLALIAVAAQFTGIRCQRVADHRATIAWYSATAPAKAGGLTLLFAFRQDEVGDWLGRGARYDREQYQKPERDLLHEAQH